MSDTEKKWLVKSNSLINGPYQFDEVVENIFRGDIHLLDEIKGPYERWRPIRDHSLFAAAIERLKASTYQQREVTITEALDLNTHTMDMTQTSTETFGPVEQTRTKTLTTEMDAVTPTSKVQEPIVLNPPPQSQRNEHGIRKVKPKFRFSFAFMVTLLLLAIGAGAYLFFDFNQTKIVEKNLNSFDKFTDQALINLKIGNYKEALRYFSKAYEISPNDPNLILEMSPLLVQFDGQSGQVQVMIENLLGTRYQKEFMKRGKNIISMSLSYRGQYSDALREVDKSLGVDDQYYSALINKGYTFIELDQPREAIQVLKRAIPIEPKQGIGRYLLTRAFIAEGIKSKNKRYFQEALSTSNEFSQNFFDFKQEILFFRAIAKINLGATGGELETAVRNMLQVDPALTSAHVHDVSQNFQSFDWQKLARECEFLSQSLKNYSGALLMGFCNLKAGNALKAKKMFESLLSQRSKDGVLQALYLASLLELDNFETVKNNIDLLPKIYPPKPFAEVLLRACIENNDLECVSRIINSPQGNGISLLYSHWSNVKLNLSSQKEKAKSSMIQGLSISPRFRPLLELRRAW